MAISIVHKADPAKFTVQHLQTLHYLCSRVKYTETTQPFHSLLIAIIADMAPILREPHLDFLANIFRSEQLPAEIEESMIPPIRFRIRITRAAYQLYSNSNVSESVATLCEACADQSTAEFLLKRIEDNQVISVLQKTLQSTLSNDADALSTPLVQQIREIVTFMLSENRMAMTDFQKLLRSTIEKAYEFWDELVVLFDREMIAFLVNSIVALDRKLLTRRHLELAALVVLFDDEELVAKCVTLSWQLLEEGISADADITDAAVELLCKVSAPQINKFKAGDATPAVVGSCIGRVKQNRSIAATLCVMRRICIVDATKKSLLIERVIAGDDGLLDVLLSAMREMGQAEQVEPARYLRDMQSVMDFVVFLAENIDRALLSAQLKEDFHRECVEAAKTSEVRAMGIAALQKVVDLEIEQRQ